MTDMIERVAKAIYAVKPDIHDDGGERMFQPVAWEDLDNHVGASQRHYRDMARAAIAAMREPTEEMVKAGEVADDECSEASPHTASHMIYSAMIDAALGGSDADAS